MNSTDFDLKIKNKAWWNIKSRIMSACNIKPTAGNAVEILQQLVCYIVTEL